MVSGKSCIVLSISHSSSFDRALLSERRSNGPDGQAVDAPSPAWSPASIRWRMHVSEAPDRVIRRRMRAWERCRSAGGSLLDQCQEHVLDPNQAKAHLRARRRLRHPPQHTKRKVQVFLLRLRHLPSDHRPPSAPRPPCGKRPFIRGALQARGEGAISFVPSQWLDPLNDHALTSSGGAAWLHWRLPCTTDSCPPSQPGGA